MPLSMETLASFSRDENASMCCSTRGLVGAIMRTLPLSRNSAATRTAMTVLPSPVGRIRSVFARTHCSTMRVWYPLSSTLSGTMRG